MPRKAIWGSGLLVAAICVVAIVRAQDRNWQPVGRPGQAPAQLGEPAPLPPGAGIDAMPVAAQFEQPPPDGTVPAGIFGRAERRFGGKAEATPATEAATVDSGEPRPFPPVNHIGPPPLSPPTTVQPSTTPAGPLPTRSVLRKPGMPAPQSSPSDQPAGLAPASQSISDDSESAVPARSVLKRPVGPVVGDQVRAIAPVQEAPAPITDIHGSSRRIYDPNATVPSPSVGMRASATRGQDVVVASQAPRLRVELAGPQALMVGKSARYVLNLVNEGDAVAQEVQLRVHLPSWVSFDAGETTSGEADAQPDGQGGTRMVWTLPQVKANSQETIRLQLVANSGQPFEITADWTCKPASLKAAIVARQPQLELSLAGPSDMVFGEEKPFTISISNPGNGDAEQVTVEFIAGGNAPQTIDVGAVPAGKARDVVVKIVANQPNGMDLKLSATGEGNLRAEAAGRIVVKQPVLAVTVEGPPLKFAGAEAIYSLTVSNTGNAAADDLSVSATLPSGAKYLGGVEGATFAGNVLKWKAGVLPPETERTYEIRCQLNAAGAHRCVVQAQGPKTSIASHEAETTVEAVSNLKLAVNDPTGPAPTGQDVTYEVQLMNRGSLAAKNVKLVMQFSEGFEPTSVQGAEARVVPGQVLFETLPELGAGEQVIVHVKAQAGKEGSHRFRVEVVSADNDTRLVSEGTTRFFTDARGPASSAAARTATKPKVVPSPTQNLQR
jgi:hypothetical protein